MAREIKKAHLIIARSGSSSLVEFCVAKKPMILIPFAKSADNHQFKNAKVFEKAGAAILLEEKDFTINMISKIINNLLVDNKDLLLKMSDNCAKIANLNATQNLVNLIEND
jgi:UDP-N-acetylglucosamine--N-acetylmuramyl-(pentapeptide) pyrophosphoryl-undecaprenol N-acetylglucosamine transferase